MINIKQITLVLFFSILQINGTAQPLVQEGAKWNILVFYGFEGTKSTFTWKIDGDTSINNISYKTMYTSGDSLNLNWFKTDDYIRENASKKVYYKEGNSDEFLLYDFGLVVGDTFTINECNITVVEIDTILLNNGEERKRMKMESPGVGSFTDAVYWVEGIGSEAGLINHWRLHCSTDHEYSLLCFYNDSELLYQINPLGCYFNSTSITELGRNDEIEVYPNPTKDIFRIELKKENLMIKEIKLFSVMGKVLDVADLNTVNTEVDISTFPTGVYYLLIKLDKGQLLSKKILKVN